MLKYYFSDICGDCREADALFAEKGFSGFERVDITASTANLREFLDLRDHRPEFAPVREGGFIGIPCFLRDDGSITFEPEEVLKEAQK